MAQLTTETLKPRPSKIILIGELKTQSLLEGLFVAKWCHFYE